LTVTYGFPDRARWYLEPAQAEVGQRSVRYRSGPQVWELFPGASEAAQYQEEQELRAFLQLELRRAALLWPHGFEWETRVADGQDASVLTASSSIKTGGALSVTLETGCPPTSFRSELDGEVFEEYRNVKWTEGPLGKRPLSWTLYHSGVEIWAETIDRFHADIRYVDGHFLPPHLRELPGGDESDSVLLGEVPARVRRRYALSAPSWEEAHAEAKRIIATNKGLGLPGVIDPNPVFELDSEGLPSALFVRLILVEQIVPQGWEEASGESALSLLIPSGRLPSSADVESLMAARPKGAEVGTPRLRLRLVGGEIETSQLLLPLTPGVHGD
jgi:hypothetical protein